MPKLVRKLSILPYQALGACFNTYKASFNRQTWVFLSSIFKSNFLITLYHSGTLAQLQLNLHNHVLALCAFCKALSVSLSGSMSSTLSSIVPSGVWDSAPATAMRLRMTASFLLWLLKSESNSSYFITTTVSSETESGSIIDTEDSSSSFMEVTLSFIIVMFPWPN